MTVGEFQQGGNFMLLFDYIAKAMQKRSFLSEFKEMIEEAENKMMEKSSISEEDLKVLLLVPSFRVCYDFQKNKIEIHAESENLLINYYKKVIDSEIEEMKNLSDFLENQYAKKPKYFDVSFNNYSGYEASIFVYQKKVDKEVWGNKCSNQKEYFEQMSRDLESDLKKIGIICVDVSKLSDWSAKVIID